MELQRLHEQLLAQGSSERAVSSEEEFGGRSGETQAREHPANERTRLACIRTGVSLISFGLGIQRLGVEGGLRRDLWDLLALGVQAALRWGSLTTTQRFVGKKR